MVKNAAFVKMLALITWNLSEFKIFVPVSVMDCLIIRSLSWIIVGHSLKGTNSTDISASISTK